MLLHKLCAFYGACGCSDLFIALCSNDVHQLAAAFPSADVKDDKF